MIPEGRSILLVDDESDIVNSVKRWLKADGFNVHGFTNSLQALEYFQNNYDKIDLVLSDIAMRKLNGYELVKKIKSIRPEIKVVLMTALEIDLPELSKILPSIKIDGFMLKPGRIENLVKTIKSIFLTSSVG
ncbi:MAG TPA: response regulator [Nitrososphaeraceae archaeon]|nr:response regulator [Nitrososphaeraceae archaeon]